jgi:hypothetical protein
MRASAAKATAAATATAFALALGAVSCTAIRRAVGPSSIAQVSPEPVTPLAPPTETMKGGKGDADAHYPSDFDAVVKSDGTIVFPQHTLGHIKGSSLFVGGDPVLTVGADGEVKGVGLKHRYRFDDAGALLDEQGHGVRLEPGGGVRGVGGEWSYKDVFSWTPEGGGKWDDRGWRTLVLVSLVIIENMLPEAIRLKEAPDGGKDKGLTIRIPPPSEWFK